MLKIILASKSKQRKKMLEDAGISFEVVVSNADETPIQVFSLEEKQKEVSMRKALTVMEMTKDLGDRVIVSAEQNLVFDNTLCEKLNTMEEARKLLKAMNGHDEIYTYVGNTILYISNFNVIDYINTCDVAKLRMDTLTDEELEDYLISQAPWNESSGINIINAPFLHLEEGKVSTATGMTIEYLTELLSNI